MSARLITLAINIAVMGALLVTGINSYLLSAFPLSSPDVSEVGQLHVLSQKIASGSLENIPSFENVPSLKAVQPFIRPALVHGFGGVMLYAAIGVWVLAGFSALIFGIRTTKTDLPRTTQPDCCV
jgi:hypothetical protein